MMAAMLTAARPHMHTCIKIHAYKNQLEQAIRSGDYDSYNNLAAMHAAARPEVTYAEQRAPEYAAVPAPTAPNNNMGAVPRFGRRAGKPAPQAEVQENES